MELKKNYKSLQINDQVIGPSSKYGMSISVEKIKVMVNSNDKNVKYEQFIYLGAILTKDGTISKNRTDAGNNIYGEINHDLEEHSY